MLNYFEWRWDLLKRGRALPPLVAFGPHRLIYAGADLFTPQVAGWVVDEAMDVVVSNGHRHTFAASTMRPELMRTYMQNWRNRVERDGRDFAPPANLWLGLDITGPLSLAPCLSMLQETPAHVKYLHFKMWDACPLEQIKPRMDTTQFVGATLSRYPCVDWAIINVDNLLLDEADGIEISRALERRGVPCIRVYDILKDGQKVFGDYPEGWTPPAPEVYEGYTRGDYQAEEDDGLDQL